VGLFSRGPEKVIKEGRRVRGRIVAMDFVQKSENESTILQTEYVVELDASEGGRRLGVRQTLSPNEYVRLGMEVAAVVRGDDLFIDWANTMAAQGVHGTNETERWKGGRDATRQGVTDANIGLQKVKNGERGVMRIEQFRSDSKFGGLIVTTTIVGTVKLGTDEPYLVEIPKQQLPYYATHLGVVGQVVPVLVSEKRLDKVVIDWPSAVQQQPGIGVPPAADAQDGGQAGSVAMMAGGGSPVVVPGAVPPPPPGAQVPPPPGVQVPPPPGVQVPPPPGAPEPPPIAGVTWSQYLALERAIAQSGGHGRRTKDLVEQHGLSYPAYAEASAGFAKAMMRNPAMQMAFAAAIQ
jgi:hypothetical protein